MQRRRHCHHQISHPTIVSVTRRYPFTVFQLAGDHVWLLLCRTVDEKEPRVETSRIERRRYPTSDVCEVIRVEIQLVMLQQRRPRHSPRLEIVEQRSALPFRERFAALSNEHAELFEQL